jgi:hypothetical protein
VTQGLSKRFGVWLSTMIPHVNLDLHLHDLGKLFHIGNHT